MSIIWLGIVLLILFLFYKLRNKNTVIEESTNNLNDFLVVKPERHSILEIPKVVWLYWHDLDHIPSIVSKCIDSMIYFNRDYIINILDDSRFKELTGIDINQAFSKTNNKSYQKKSDFIRLNIIYRYGGIWLDASIICTKSLNWIHDIQKSKKFPDKTYYETICFMAPDTENNPVIDSWFIASVPRSLFIFDWMNEFNDSLQYTNDAQYCKEIISNYPVPTNLKKYLPYLTIHLCNWVVRYNNPNLYKIYFLSSTEEGAPFYYINKYKWNSRKMLKSFIHYPKLCDMKLFKLTNGMRHDVATTNYRYKTNNAIINYVLDNIY